MRCKILWISRIGKTEAITEFADIACRFPYLSCNISKIFETEDGKSIRFFNFCGVDEYNEIKSDDRESLVAYFERTFNVETYTKGSTNNPNCEKVLGLNDFIKNDVSFIIKKVHCFFDDEEHYIIEITTKTHVFTFIRLFEAPEDGW